MKQKTCSIQWLPYPWVQNVKKNYLKKIISLWIFPCLLTWQDMDKNDSNDVKHILPLNISFPRNARGSNYCSCQESTSCSWLFTITDATNCLLAPVWVSSCQKRVLTAHDRIHILSTKTNSADCQHYLHTIVYTDLLTIPSTRMKSSYLKWDMSIPNKYGLTFCWTSWNKNIQVWRSHQIN